jgi:hypothetical protein
MASHRKTHLFGVAQPGSSFVHLQMREVQVAEGALVQGLSMLTCTGQPGGNGGLPKALRPARPPKDPALRPARDPHHGDVMGRGFQPRQRRVAPGSEGGTAGRASKGLDLLGLAVLAISDQGVDLSIGDPGVRTLRVGTGESLGVDPNASSPPACDLAPGTHRERRWSHSRRRSGDETTGGAIVWAAGRCRRRWSLLRILAAALDGAGP